MTVLPRRLCLCLVLPNLRALCLHVLDEPMERLESFLANDIGGRGRVKNPARSMWLIRARAGVWQATRVSGAGRGGCDSL